MPDILRIDFRVSEIGRNVGFRFWSYFYILYLVGGHLSVAHGGNFRWLDVAQEEVLLEILVGRYIVVP